MSPSTELYSGPGTSFRALDLPYTLYPKLHSQVSHFRWLSAAYFKYSCQNFTGEAVASAIDIS